MNAMLGLLLAVTQLRRLPRRLQSLGLRPWAAIALALSALGPLPAAHAAEHAVILLYHHVAADTPAVTSIDPQLFAQHLDHLEKNAYQVLALPELLQKLHNGQAVPDKSVALTFDDAYRNVYDHAFPLLAERGWPFTVFINTDAVDGRYGSHLSWDQLREMGRAGATVANHSATHAHLGARLAGESDAAWRKRIREDLAKAQRRIKEETGQDHALFAYPYGEFTPELQRLVTELGYIGIGQHSGAVGPGSDFTALPRYPMAAGYATMNELREKLATRPLPVASIERPGNPLPAGERPRLVVTLAEPLSRPDALRCYAGGQGAIPVTWHSERQFSTQAPAPLPAGRSRYNCTAPAAAGGFFWYSAPWISLDTRQRWPPD